MTCFVFSSPPVANAYTDLVRFGCVFGSHALLVVRDPDIDPGSSIADILVALLPFIENSARAEEWPGTRLFGHDAMLHRYRTSPEFADALLTLRPSLLSWLHPDAPEDLCFLRIDGRPLLVTVSHESDAYMLLDREEVSEIQNRYPTLAAAIRPE